MENKKSSQIALRLNSYKKLIQKGHTAGYRIRHARILLALDEIPANSSLTDRMIAAAYGPNIRSIGNLGKRFVEEGFEAAVERKKRPVPPVMTLPALKAKLDPRIQAALHIDEAVSERHVVFFPCAALGRPLLRLVRGGIVGLSVTLFLRGLGAVFGG